MHAEHSERAAILIVDDSPTNLKVLVDALGQDAYEVFVATDGESALEQLNHVRPDLILMDVQMPGMNGFETCRRLKVEEDSQDIPVIFMTALSETEDKVTGFQAGAVDYITKPFQYEEVLMRIRTHLQISRLTHEIQAQAERKFQFLANMSHEFRTPITSIKGYVDNMLDGIGGALTERHRSNLSRVQQNSDHLLNLVNDILDLSKIEAGRMDLAPQWFEVGELIASCCDTVEPLVKPGVVLKQDMSEDIERAYTDPGRLRQILINLLSNALKFTEEGEVRVKVGNFKLKNENYKLQITRSARELEAGNDAETMAALEIAVSDTGVGIPRDAQGLIFEEFQQVKGSDKQHKGTGLGLPITKRLTGLLGGTIGMESQEGKGSTFTVRIPLVYRAV